MIIIPRPSIFHLMHKNFKIVRTKRNK